MRFSRLSSRLCFRPEDSDVCGVPLYDLCCNSQVDLGISIVELKGCFMKDHVSFMATTAEVVPPSSSNGPSCRRMIRF